MKMSQIIFDKIYPNITFTEENSQNGKLPFFDILISNSVFQHLSVPQNQYKSVLTNFKSFAPFWYKTRII